MANSPFQNKRNSNFAKAQRQYEVSLKEQEAKELAKKNLADEQYTNLVKNISAAIEELRDKKRVHIISDSLASISMQGAFVEK